MSFKDDHTSQLTILNQTFDFHHVFEKELAFVLSSAQCNPDSNASIILGDSRYLEKYTQDSFDLLITSPPYPNRMSYIRELRPYMYWLGYLKEAREAGEIDWGTIGGTWGIATSRLLQWQAPQQDHNINELSSFLSALTESNEKNAVLLLSMSPNISLIFGNILRMFEPFYRKMLKSTISWATPPSMVIFSQLKLSIKKCSNYSPSIKSRLHQLGREIQKKPSTNLSFQQFARSFPKYFSAKNAT